MRGKYLVVLLLVLLSIQFVSADENAITLEETLEREGKAQVIIFFPEEEQKINQQRLRTARSSNDIPNTIDELDDIVELPLINGFSGELSKRDYEDLKEKYPNAVIHKERVFKLDEIIVDTNPRENLATSVPAVGANYSWNVLNISGSGIKIAIIDSGLNYSEDALGGCIGPTCKVIDGYDYVNTDSDPMDDRGHGTHVAVTAAGNNTTYMGVAPNASLFALKACNSVGDCFETPIINSITWAVNNNSDIISMSLGGSASAALNGNSGTDALAAAVNSATTSGVVVVTSAGNSGPGASTIGTPVHAATSIAVGATNDQGTVSISDDTMASFSSRGPILFGRFDPEVSAPGTSITAPYLGGQPATISGTSMAAPHVSGLAALMIEQNTTLTPSQIRAKIISATTSISDDVFVQGAGTIDVQQALTAGVYATAEHTNTVGDFVATDRVEAIVYPYTMYYANITIHNVLNEELNFSSSLAQLESVYGGETLANTSFSFQENVTVPAHGNATIEVNISINNSATAASVYGGILHFSAFNSSNGLITARLPVAVTVPYINTVNISWVLDQSGTSATSGAAGDVYHFAYYNNKSGNDTFQISWPSSADDIDLYLYETNGSYLDRSATTSEPETITTTNSDTLKWFRFHGYDFSGGSITVNLTITDNDNTPATIDNFSANATAFFINQTVLVFADYNNSDNDSLIFTINDSRFIENDTLSNTSRQAYTYRVNSSDVGTISLELMIEDPYNVTTIATTNVTVTNTSLQIINATPSNRNLSIQKPANQTFFTNATDLLNLTINISWYVNGTLNISNNSFYFISTDYTVGNYTITANYSTTQYNASEEWNVTILPENNGVIFNFSNNISDVTWDEGDTATNAINLANHFFDNNSDELTYTLFNTTDITMSVSSNQATFTPVSGSYFGTSYVYIVANDTATTNATSNVFRLVVTEEEEDDDDSGGSSGGSSGGGGGTAGGSTSSERISQLIPTATDTIQISNDNGELSLSELKIDFDGTQENVRVVVEQYETTDTGEPPEAKLFPRTRYKTLTIEANNLDDNDIEEATIDFFVSLDWLDDNNINTNDVRLYRYTTNNWQELETDVKGKNSTHQKYEATTPGFSTFVISTVQEIAVEAAVLAEEESNNDNASDEVLLEDFIEEQEVQNKEVPELQLGLDEDDTNNEDITGQAASSDDEKRSVKLGPRIIGIGAFVLVLSLIIEIIAHRKHGKEFSKVRVKTTPVKTKQVKSSLKQKSRKKK